MCPRSFSVASSAVGRRPKIALVQANYNINGEWIIGLDLSLRAAAACAIPLDWDGMDLSKLRTTTVGRPVEGDDERAHLLRLHDIAEEIRAFVWLHTPLAVYVEQYAFGSSGAHAARIREGGGVVKYRLFRKCNVVCEPVVASSARKTLLVKCPRSDAKKFVVKNMRRLEGIAREWSEDEIDAFVIANHGMALLGRSAMSFQGV